MRAPGLRLVGVRSDSFRPPAPSGEEMCGSAGAYRQPEGKLLTSVMVERLAHRGPDTSAVPESVNPRASVVLGQLRLSIIDLSSAADGPRTKNGLTITYNGALYNYRQLRAELERSGVAFATSRQPTTTLEGVAAWSGQVLETTVQFDAVRRA